MAGSVLVPVGAAHGDVRDRGCSELAQIGDSQRVHRPCGAGSRRVPRHEDDAQGGAQFEKVGLDGSEVGRAAVHRTREPPAAEA